MKPVVVGIKNLPNIFLRLDRIHPPRSLSSLIGSGWRAVRGDGRGGFGGVPVAPQPVTTWP